MPQVSEQHSTVQRNDAIENSLQIGLATLGSNLLAKRQEKQRQNQAANLAADVMRTDWNHIDNGASMEFKDGLMNVSPDLGDYQAQLMKDKLAGNPDDLSQRDLVTPLTKVAGQPVVPDVSQEAKDFRAKEALQPANVAAANASVEINNRMSGNTAGTTQPTPPAIVPPVVPPAVTPVVPTGTTPVTPTPVTPVVPPVAPVAGALPTPGFTGSANKVAQGTKKRENLSSKTELSAYTQEREDTTLYQMGKQEAIRDELKTSIGDLRRLSDFRSISNALTGATDNPYTALQSYRQQFIASVQDKIGMRTKTEAITTKQKIAIGGSNMTTQQGVNSEQNTSISNSTSSHGGGGAKQQATEAGKIQVGQNEVTAYSKEAGYSYFTSANFAVTPQTKFFEAMTNGLVLDKGGNKMLDKNGTYGGKKMEITYNGHPYIYNGASRQIGIVKDHNYATGDLELVLGMGVGGTKSQTRPKP